MNAKKLLSIGKTAEILGVQGLAVVKEFVLGKIILHTPIHTQDDTTITEYEVNDIVQEGTEFYLRGCLNVSFVPKVQVKLRN